MPPVRLANEDTWVLAASGTMAYLGKGGGNQSTDIKHGGTWLPTYFLQLKVSILKSFFW